MKEDQESLIIFFKALADANRLKIIGLLSQQEYSVEQLAEILHLRPSTVSHHLTQLAKAGLIRSRTESYYNLYRLEKGVLEATARRLLERPSLTAQELDLEAYDRKVLRDYLMPDGQLKTIPAQRKKLEAVLRHICSAFEPGRRYSEAEVNHILSQFHEDTARLRREMVGYQLLKRAKGEYWRPESG